jgi:hypothetical protein
MKLSELKVGTEYAIVPSWTYNSRSARSVDSVRENDVVKGTLLELTKYEYEPSSRKSDKANFVKAQAGNRSVGVLVEAVDNQGKTIYWTSRLADIVAPYAELEPKWSQANKEQEAKEREYKEQQARIEALKEKVYAEVNRSKVSVERTSKELLGQNTSVEVGTTGYNENLKGVVTISLAEFEQLIELAYAGKEVFA